MIAGPDRQPGSFASQIAAAWSTAPIRTGTPSAPPVKSPSPGPPNGRPRSSRSSTTRTRACFRTESRRRLLELTNAITSGTSPASSRRPVPSSTQGRRADRGLRCPPCCRPPPSPVPVDPVDDQRAGRQRREPNQDAALKPLEFFTEPTSQDMFRQGQRQRVPRRHRQHRQLRLNLAGLGDFLTDPSARSAAEPVLAERRRQ